MDVSSDFYPMFHYQFRIILIGDSTVGKSSLLRYFTEGRCAEISDPTVGVDFYARMVEIKPNFRIKLQLWDTAGQEKFKSITRSYYRNSVGVIIVYDITNRKSFDHVVDWLSEAEANIGGPDPSQCVFLLKGQVCGNIGSFWENVNECFTMMAREINARFETGALRLCDGWDGIKSGLMRTQSITLSDISQEPPSSQCSC
uniref:Uncharacterized protein n=1 Tax=Ditylenchus dipsaci TaxID=166011 RepID=A0A915CUK5_9BILA